MNETPTLANLGEDTSTRKPLAPASSPAAVEASATRLGALLGWVTQGIPNLLVLGLLAGLAYWGHQTGWTMPTLSSLLGRQEAAPPDWCAEHGVPESQCVECNPHLLPRGKERPFCKKHGVAECPLEYPEIAQLAQTPTISAADRARAERALAFRARPENNSKCKLHHRRIQFASLEAVEKAGIEIQPVWEAPIVESVSAYGEVTYDQTRVARLSSRAPGTVWKVTKQVGDRVTRGEVLALVDAAEVGKAKTGFLQAIVLLRLRSKTYEQYRQLPGAIAEQRVREAETALQEAQIRLLSAQQALNNLGLPVDADALKEYSEKQLAAHLQFLGLPASLRQTLDPQTTTANLLPVVAALDGIVVNREVVAGEVVDPSKVLLVVADVRHLWLMLHPRQEDAQKLAPGQTVHFRADGTGQTIQGSISWISTAVDEKTRTVKVRVDLENPEGGLRASTFGQGQIVLREEKNAIVVPSEAVHWEGCCHVVFVRAANFLAQDAPKVFYVRKVRLGAVAGERTEIVAGVLPGEIVATKGSGTLRAELLKNNLGEG